MKIGGKLYEVVCYDIQFMVSFTTYSRQGRFCAPKLSHDGWEMVKEWLYFTVDPPRGPGSFPVNGRELQGIFPWLATLCQPILIQRMVQSISNGTAHLVDIQEEGLCPTTDKQRLQKVNLVEYNSELNSGTFGLSLRSCLPFFANC